MLFQRNVKMGMERSSCSKQQCGNTCVYLSTGVHLFASHELEQMQLLWYCRVLKGADAVGVRVVNRRNEGRRHHCDDLTGHSFDVARVQPKDDVCVDRAPRLDLISDDVVGDAP